MRRARSRGSATAERLVRSMLPRRNSSGNSNININSNPPSSSLRASMPPNAMNMNANTAKVASIECQTQEGQIKQPTVLYKKGMQVIYKGHGVELPAKILEVHFDDELEPYYTILREDGVEKQTDNAHLSLLVLTEGPFQIPTKTSSPPRQIPSRSSSPPRPLREQSDVTGASSDTFLMSVSQDKRKKSGLCVSCGQVQTHKPGHWVTAPKTVEGLVYKGLCLKCNTLDTAKLKLGEPIGEPTMTDDPPRRLPTRRNTTEPPRHHSLQPKNNANPLQGSGTDPTIRPGRHSSLTPRLIPLHDTISSVRRLQRLDSSGSSHRKSDLTTSSARHLQRLDSSGSSRRKSDLRRRPPAQAGELEFKPANVRPGKRTTVRRKKDGNLSTSLPQTKASDAPGEYFEVQVHRRSSVGARCSEESSIFASQKNQHADNIVGSSAPLNNNNRITKETKALIWSQTQSTALDSILYSSNEDSKSSAETPGLGLANITVDEFRCSDSNGDTGFYTGTMTRFYNGTEDDHGETLPHGRGAMIYDSGHIVKGVWSKGDLRVKVSLDQEIYEPYLLPGYSVGDVGHAGDMVKATTLAASKLHVNDCAFIRRSNGTWSYAIVLSHSDSGAETSIKLRATSKGSTKTVPMRQWSGHLMLPAKPDVHQSYSVGDPGHEEDMIISPPYETVLSVSKLRVDDACFVRRSNGSWTYAIVIESDVVAINRAGGEDVKITFDINNGSTKSILASQSGTNVRRIKHKQPSDKEANVIPELVSKTRRSSQRHTRGVTREDGNANKGSGEQRQYLASDEPDKLAAGEPNAGPQKEWLESSSFQLEKPLMQHIYCELDRRNEESSIGSITAGSSRRRSSKSELKYSPWDNRECQALEIYDNRHHDVIADDDALFTDDNAGSSRGGHSSLMDGSVEGISANDMLLMSLRARQRRRTSMEMDDSNYGDNSIENCGDSFKQKRGSHKETRRAKTSKKERSDEKNDFTDDEGYSTLTDGSKQSLRAHAKDRLLMSLLARAALEDIDDAENSARLSLDESLLSLHESFVEWRQNQKKSITQNEKI